MMNNNTMSQGEQHFQIVDHLIHQIHQHLTPHGGQEPRDAGDAKDHNHYQHRQYKLHRGDNGKRGNLNRVLQASHKLPSPALNFLAPCMPELNSGDIPANLTYSAKAKSNLSSCASVSQPIVSSASVSSASTSAPTTSGCTMCDKCEYHFVDGQFVLKSECFHGHHMLSSASDSMTLTLGTPRAAAESGLDAQGLLPTPGLTFPAGSGTTGLEYYRPRGGPRNRSFYNRNKMLERSLGGARNFYLGRCPSPQPTALAPSQLNLWSAGFEFPQINAARWQSMQRCVINQESCRAKMKTYGREADVVIENGVLKVVPCKKDEDGKETEKAGDKDDDNKQDDQVNPKVLQLFKHFESAEPGRQICLGAMPQPQKSLELSNLSTFIETVAASNQSSMPSPPECESPPPPQPMRRLFSEVASGCSNASPNPTPPVRRAVRVVLPSSTCTPVAAPQSSPRLSPTSLREMRSVAKTFKTIEIDDCKVDCKPLDLGSIDFEPLGYANFDGRNVALYKNIAYVNRHRKRFIQPSLDLLKMLLTEKVKRARVVQEDSEEVEELESDQEEGEDDDKDEDEQQQDDHESDGGGGLKNKFDMSQYYEADNSLSYEKKYVYSVLDQLIDEDGELARQVKQQARQVKQQAYRFAEHSSDDENDEKNGKTVVSTVKHQASFAQQQQQQVGRPSTIAAYSVHDPFIVDQKQIKHCSHSQLKAQRSASSFIVVNEDKQISLPDVLIRQLREDRSAIEKIFLQAHFVTEISLV